MQDKIFVHPRVGSPVYPGLQLHVFEFPKLLQSALTPQVPGMSQILVHLFLTQVNPGLQKEMSPSHSILLHSVFGFPAVWAGQKQIACLFSILHLALTPHLAESQGFLHLPAMQTAVSGHSISVEQVPGSLHPLLYGSPTFDAGH